MSEVRDAPVALWRRADLLLLFGALGAGLLLIAVGYWGVSGTRVFDDQVSSARLAAIGVLLAQAGIVRSVIAGRRALGRRLQSTLRQPTAAPATVGAGPQPAAAPVAAGDMTRYHRPGCAFVAGKAILAGSAAEHERAGRRPCGMCHP